ncbi:bifunctional 2-polyprenyl-6-hydroxyphenol methylase/3-demethylubiquinol 3-O-methyltransferase UbiG [Paenibacillus sp. BC26]|uniref:class I SAM-dependent methyltransferase n=1 Tax=Paenibacillus sp. BC26 TaxID=1881032 RepID=UPI0008E1DE76|nr:class I SAM-dependent methyltransferase [Paenibacillus sp. BC26]SFT21220.1 Methyltransferase domain-containing protein [Paenibacillus sp. BC26]
MSIAKQADTSRLEQPYSEQQLGLTELTPSYRVDLRPHKDKAYERFIRVNTVKDWSQLTWERVGKPYEVRTMSEARKQWEQEHEKAMDAKTSWTYFNKAFHEWFDKDIPKEISGEQSAFLKSLATFKPSEIRAALGDVARIHLWNYVHRIQDGVWDPRGKRSLFEGLNVTRPRILFLGAAEGYEAMQLAALYPGAEVVMVDYDAYCKTVRHGEFPDSYPFLGSSSSTGGAKVYYKPDFNIEYVVDDVRNLSFGKSFDIVLSVGLLEHFPDTYKPEVVDWHRRFLKDGGYAIFTTPRNQWKSRLFYVIMADIMNHTYRELMTVEQMGLYIYENGFDIIRHGYIKAHNAVIAQVR